MLLSILARWSQIIVKLLSFLFLLPSNSVLSSMKLPTNLSVKTLSNSSSNFSNELELREKIRNLIMSDLLKVPFDGRGFFQENQAAKLVEEDPNLPLRNIKSNIDLINNKHGLVLAPEQKINVQSKRRRHSDDGTVIIKTRMSRPQRKRKLVSHKRKKLSAESLQLGGVAANPRNSSCRVEATTRNLSRPEIFNPRMSTLKPLAQENKSSSISPNNQNNSESFEKVDATNTTTKIKTATGVIKDQNSINPSVESTDIVSWSSPKFPVLNFSTFRDFRDNDTFLKSVLLEIPNYSKDYLRKLFPAVTFDFPSSRANHSKVCKSSSLAPPTSSEPAMSSSQNSSVRCEKVAVSNLTETSKIRKNNSTDRNVSCGNLGLRVTSISLRNGSSSTSGNLFNQIASTASLRFGNSTNLTSQSISPDMNPEKRGNFVTTVVNNNNETLRSALTNASVSDDQTFQYFFKLLDGLQKNGQLFINLRNSSLCIPIPDAIRNKTLKIDHSPLANISFTLLEESSNRSVNFSNLMKVLNSTVVSSDSGNINNCSQMLNGSSNLNISLLNPKVDRHETYELRKLEQDINKTQDVNSDIKVNKTKKPSINKLSGCATTTCQTTTCLSVNKTEITTPSTVKTGAPTCFSQNRSISKSISENEISSSDKNSVTIKSTTVSLPVTRAKQDINDKVTALPSSTEALSDEEKICQAKLELLQLVRKLILNNTCDIFGKNNFSKPLNGNNDKNFHELLPPAVGDKERDFNNEKTVELTQEFIDDTMNAFNIVTKLPFFVDHVPSVDLKTEPKSSISDQINIAPNVDGRKFELKVFMDGHEVFNDMVTGDSSHSVKLAKMDDSSRYKIDQSRSGVLIGNKQKSNFPNDTNFVAFRNPAKKRKNILKRIKSSLFNFGKAKFNSVKNLDVKDSPTIFIDGFDNDPSDSEKEKLEEVEPAFLRRRLQYYCDTNEAANDDVDSENNKKNQAIIRSVTKKKRSNRLSKLKTDSISQDSVESLLISLANKPEYLPPESSSAASESLPVHNKPEVLNANSPFSDVNSRPTLSTDYNNLLKNGKIFFSNAGLKPTFLKPIFSLPFVLSSNYVNVSNNLKNLYPSKFFLDSPDANRKLNKSKLVKILSDDLNLKKLRPHRLLAVIVNTTDSELDSLNGKVLEMSEQKILPLESINLDPVNKENSTVTIIEPAETDNPINGSSKNDGSSNSVKSAVAPSSSKAPIANPGFNMFNSSLKLSVITNKSSADPTSKKKLPNNDGNEIIPATNSSIIFIQNTTILRIPVFYSQIRDPYDKDLNILNLSVASFGISPQILSKIAMNTSVLKSFSEIANAESAALQNLKNVLRMKIENSTVSRIVDAPALNSSISIGSSPKVLEKFVRNFPPVHKEISESRRNLMCVNRKNPLLLSTENTIFPVRSPFIASNLTDGEFHRGKELCPKLKAEVKSKIEFLTPVILLNRSTSPETNSWTDRPSEKRILEEVPIPVNNNGFSRNISTSSKNDSFAQATEELPNFSSDLKPKPPVDEKKLSGQTLNSRQNQEFSAYLVNALVINDTKTNQFHSMTHNDKSNGLLLDNFFILVPKNESNSSLGPLKPHSGFGQNTQLVNLLNIPSDLLKNLSIPALIFLAEVKDKTSNFTIANSLPSTILEDKQGICQFTDDGTQYVANEENQYAADSVVSQQRVPVDKKNFSVAKPNGSKSSLNSSDPHSKNLIVNVSAVAKKTGSPGKVPAHRSFAAPSTSTFKNLIKAPITRSSNIARKSSLSSNRKSSLLTLVPTKMQETMVSNGLTNLHTKRVFFSSSTAQQNISKPTKHYSNGKIIPKIVTKQNQVDLKVSDSSPVINYSEKVGQDQVAKKGTEEKNSKFSDLQFVKHNNSERLSSDKKNSRGLDSVSSIKKNPAETNHNRPEKSKNREKNVPRPETKIEIPTTENFLVTESEKLNFTVEEKLSTDSTNTKLRSNMKIQDANVENISEPANLSLNTVSPFQSTYSTNLNQLSDVSEGMMTSNQDLLEPVRTNFNPVLSTSSSSLADSFSPPDKKFENIRTTPLSKNYDSDEFSISSRDVTKITSISSKTSETTEISSVSSRIDERNHSYEQSLLSAKMTSIFQRFPAGKNSDFTLSSSEWGNSSSLLPTEKIPANFNPTSSRAINRSRSLGKDLSLPVHELNFPTNSAVTPIIFVFNSYHNHNCNHTVPSLNQKYMVSDKEMLVVPVNSSASVDQLINFNGQTKLDVLKAYSKHQNNRLGDFLNKSNSQEIDLPNDGIFESNFVTSAYSLNPAYNTRKIIALSRNQIHDSVPFGSPILDNSTFLFPFSDNRSSNDSTSLVDVVYQVMTALPDSRCAINVNTSKVLSSSSENAVFSSDNVGTSARTFFSNEDPMRIKTRLSLDDAFSNISTLSHNRENISGKVENSYVSDERNASSSLSKSSISAEVNADSRPSKNISSIVNLSKGKKTGVEYQLVQPPVIILSSSLKSSPKKVPFKVFQATKLENSNFKSKSVGNFKVQTSSAPVRILHPLIVIAGEDSNSKKSLASSNIFKIGASPPTKSKKFMKMCLNLRPSKKNAAGTKKMSKFVLNQSMETQPSIITESELSDNDYQDMDDLSSSEGKLGASSSKLNISPSNADSLYSKDLLTCSQKNSVAKDVEATETNSFELLQSDVASSFKPLLNEITTVRSDILFFSEQPFQISNDQYLSQSTGYLTVAESVDRARSRANKIFYPTLLNKVSESDNQPKSKIVSNNNQETNKNNAKFFTLKDSRMSDDIDWSDKKLMGKVSDKPVGIKVLYKNVSSVAINRCGKYRPKFKLHRGLKSCHRRMYSNARSNFYYPASSKRKFNLRLNQNRVSDESEDSDPLGTLRDLYDSSVEFNHKVPLFSDQSVEILGNKKKSVELSKTHKTENSDETSSTLDKSFMKRRRPRDLKNFKFRLSAMKYPTIQTADKIVSDDSETHVSFFQRKLKSFEDGQNDGLDHYGLKSSVEGDFRELENTTEFSENVNPLENCSDKISESRSDLCSNVSDFSSNNSNLSDLISIKKDLDHFSEVLLNILKNCKSKCNDMTQSTVAKPRQGNQIFSKRQFWTASPTIHSELTVPVLKTEVKYSSSSDLSHVYSDDASESETTSLIPAVEYFPAVMNQFNSENEIVHQTIVPRDVITSETLMPSFIPNVSLQNDLIDSMPYRHSYSPINNFLNRFLSGRISSTNKEKNYDFNNPTENEDRFSRSPNQINEQDLDWVASDKNLISKQVQKLPENSTEVFPHSEFSAKDCKMTYNTNCVCDMSKVLADYDRIICEKSSLDEAKLKKILDYQCGAYLPLPVDYTISSNVKPRISASRKKQMVANSKDGPKEVDAEDLKVLLQAEVSSVENSSLYAFAGSKVAIPCFDHTKVAQPTGAVDGAEYSWQKDGKIITDGRMKELPEGMLIIENVSLTDFGSFLCTVSPVSPTTNRLTRSASTEKHVFNHTLTVVSVPKIIIQGLSYYKFNAECKPEISELFNLYLPPLIEESVCDIGEENNDICSINVVNPLCSKNNTGGSTLSLNVTMDVKGIDYMIIGGFVNKTLCSPLCHQKLYLKTSLILKESLREALANPVLGRTSITGADFIPLPSSLNLTMMIGCDAGFHQKEHFCVPCPPHTFSHEGSTECKKCSLGSYQPQYGSRGCLPCHSPLTPGCHMIGNIFDKHKKPDKKKPTNQPKNVTLPEAHNGDDNHVQKFLTRLPLLVLLALLVYCFIRPISRFFSHKNLKSISQKIIPRKHSRKYDRKSRTKRSLRKSTMQEEIELQELKPPSSLDSDSATSLAEIEVGEVKKLDGTSSSEEEQDIKRKLSKAATEGKKRITEIRKWAQALKPKSSSEDDEYIELQELKSSGDEQECIRQCMLKRVKDRKNQIEESKKGSPARRSKDSPGKRTHVELPELKPSKERRRKKRKDIQIKHSEEITRWCQGQKEKISPVNHEYVELEEYSPVRKENFVPRNGQNFEKARTVDKSVQIPERKRKPTLPQPDFT